VFGEVERSGDDEEGEEEKEHRVWRILLVELPMERICVEMERERERERGLGGGV
jgi:hypothetical protein